MSDIRASFPALEDPITLAGTPGAAVEQGDSPAGLVGAIGFAFKDAAGNLVLPQLDAEGALPVTFDAAGTIKRARGTVADQGGSLADVTGATIALTASKVYTTLAMVVSCRRAALFELVQINDVTSSVLHSVIVDAGQYSMMVSLPVDQIVAGATGIQTLKVRSKTFEKASDVYASLSVKEVS